MLSLCQSPLHNLKSTRSKEGHSALSSVIAHKGTMTPASCPYQTSLDATLYVESVRVSAGPVRSVNETLPHNCGSRYALTWRESPERAWAARAETPIQHVWHFAAILPRLLNCFLYSFSSFLSKIHWRWRSQLKF